MRNSTTSFRMLFVSVLSEMNVRRMVSGLRMLRRWAPVAGEICACCEATPGSASAGSASCCFLSLALALALFVGEEVNSRLG